MPHQGSTHPVIGGSTPAFINTRNINVGDRFKITRPDGTVIFIKINNMGTLTDGLTEWFVIDPNIHNSDFIVNWHNCYSFGNGVESNRIRDSFNKSFITSGVKVSTIFEDYKQERRGNGLIYSGLYNSTSNVNNLNQFIQAEKITKDVNPTYGSIQKLHTRNTDLVALCEDKVLRILANKDAVYNADGNINLVATENVLGQTIPFIGEFGISKNPESFASESYRSYFTDKQRGAVLRLSKDGLTPISDHGMKSWFKDNFKSTGKLLGSHDDEKDEYNLTITTSGFNLLGNSGFDVGGSWQTQELTNELTNSVLDGYTPAVSTIVDNWTELQQPVSNGIPWLTDGHMDSLYWEVQQGHAPKPFTWSCVVAHTIFENPNWHIHFATPQYATPLQGLTDSMGGGAGPWNIEIFSVNGDHISGVSTATTGAGTHVCNYIAGYYDVEVLNGTDVSALVPGDTVDFIEWVSPGPPGPPVAVPPGIGPTPGTAPGPPVSTPPVVSPPGI